MQGSFASFGNTVHSESLLWSLQVSLQGRAHIRLSPIPWTSGCVLTHNSDGARLQKLLNYLLSLCDLYFSERNVMTMKVNSRYPHSPENPLQNWKLKLRSHWYVCMGKQRTTQTEVLRREEQHG